LTLWKDGSPRRLDIRWKNSRSITSRGAGLPRDRDGWVSENSEEPRVGPRRYPRAMYERRVTMVIHG
jgi:hypothetical protein